MEFWLVVGLVLTGIPRRYVLVPYATRRDDRWRQWRSNRSRPAEGRL
jgi:hypothetical protein